MCGWPIRASLALEDVDDHLKCRFAPVHAQGFSLGENFGSVFLQLNRNDGELSSTLSFCHEIENLGKQGFKSFWLLILLDRLKNC